MAVDRASDNPFPSVLMVEGDPEDLASNPASGQRRLAVGTDHILYLVDDSGVKHQVGDAAGLAAHLADTSAAHAASAISFTPNGSIAATDVQAAIQEVRDEAGGSGGIATDTFWDAAGDLAVGTGADTAAKLAIGTTGQALYSNGTTAGWYTPYDPPAPVQLPPGNFTSSTTCAVTVATPTVGNRLLGFLSAASRGVNSITHTNVTWTQRYTGNGNSLYAELWTGVIASSPGTTATANLTGTNSNFFQVIELPSTYPAFATAGTAVTGTGASGTAYNVGPLTTARGDYVCWLITAGQASSYSVLNQPYLPLTPTGGFGRFGFFRSNGGSINLTSINVASNAWFGAMFVIS